MRFSGCRLRNLSFETPAHLTELSLAIPSEFQGDEVHIPDSVLSLSLLLGPGFERPVLVQFGRESRVRTFNYATEYWQPVIRGVFSHFSERTLKLFRQLVDE
jgi:hypothetical protein